MIPELVKVVQKLITLVNKMKNQIKQFSIRNKFCLQKAQTMIVIFKNNYRLKPNWNPNGSVTMQVLENLYLRGMMDQFGQCLNG